MSVSQSTTPSACTIYQQDQHGPACPFWSISGLKRSNVGPFGSANSTVAAPDLVFPESFPTVLR